MGLDFIVKVAVYRAAPYH